MDRSAWSKSSAEAVGARAAQGAAERFTLESHVFYWFTQVVSLRDRHLAKSLRAHDLRVPEWRVLASLEAEGSLTMGEVAALASIDRTTLTRTIDRMTKAGLLTRKRDKGDQRIWRLTLSAAGRGLFAKLFPVARQATETAMAGLDTKARGSLIATLRRMRANLAAEAGTDTNDKDPRRAT